MPIDFIWDRPQSLLEVRSYGEVTLSDFDAFYAFVEESISDPDLKKVLVVRAERVSEMDASKARKFGEAMSELIKKKHLKVAVVVGSQGRFDAHIIGAAVFEGGTPLAQFTHEKEARQWLGVS